MGRDAQFSRDGLEYIFDHLTEIEEELGKEHDLDVIAVCCDFVEDTEDNIVAYYDIDTSECTNDDERTKVIKTYLEDNTYFVAMTSRGFVYSEF
jgi:hypothetical protein